MWTEDSRKRSLEMYVMIFNLTSQQAKLTHDIFIALYSFTHTFFLCVSCVVCCVCFCAVERRNKAPYIYIYIVALNQLCEMLQQFDLFSTNSVLTSFKVWFTRKKPLNTTTSTAHEHGKVVRNKWRESNYKLCIGVDDQFLTG